ncbi:MAG TPA: hypothetical protein VGA77_06640 [Propylenella sp.]
MSNRLPSRRIRGFLRHDLQLALVNEGGLWVDYGPSRFGGERFQIGAGAPALRLVDGFSVPGKFYAPTDREFAPNMPDTLEMSATRTNWTFAVWTSGIADTAANRTMWRTDVATAFRVTMRLTTGDVPEIIVAATSGNRTYRAGVAATAAEMSDRTLWVWSGDTSQTLGTDFRVSANGISRGLATITGTGGYASQAGSNLNLGSNEGATLGLNGVLIAFLAWSHLIDATGVANGTAVNFDQMLHGLGIDGLFEPVPRRYFLAPAAAEGITGTGAVTAAAALAAASGAQVHIGTGAPSIAAALAAGAGAQVHIGTVAAASAAALAAAVAAQIHTGTVAVTAAASVADAIGLVGDVISGSADVFAAAAIAAAGGAQIHIATAAVLITGASASGVGILPISGAAAVSAAEAMVLAAGGIVITGTAAVTAAAAIVEAAGSIPTVPVLIKATVTVADSPLTSLTVSDA